MEIYTDFSKILKVTPPLGLTIGTFDGFHVGHQFIIQVLKEQLGNGTTAVVTFKNHPSDVLKKRPYSPLLYTLEHKLMLLEKSKIDIVFLLEFNTALSLQPFDVFLHQLRACYPFSYLVLGEGSSFGKDKKGDETQLKDFAKQAGFEILFLQKHLIDGEAVSSGRIRKLISEGNFELASKLLGRPYSIYGHFEASSSDVSSGHLAICSLCLPPEGNYHSTVLCKHKKLSAIASIEGGKVNIHFTQPAENYSGSLIEVIF